MKHRTRMQLLGLIVIALCSTGSNCNNPQTALPPAKKPVLDTLIATDPQGTPKPAGAPFFYSTVLKFHVPSRTEIEVAVDGWIVREQQGCGNDGCYTVLSNTDDANGQRTYVIQAFPPAYKRRANKLEFEITDVSLNAALTGRDLASEPLRLIMLEAINPVLGGPPSPFSIAGSPEWASIHDGGFLDFATIGLSTAAEADEYYRAINAIGRPDSKDTLTTWKQANGFAPANDSLDNAKAAYFNAGDLGFGRSMHMKKQLNGDVAYYVSNYPTVEDARRGTNLIATVAMEYSPGLQGGQRFTKFYVYGNDDKITHSADLDGNGQKFVPNLCIICHGVNKFTAGGSPNVGARFLPFDLASYQYSTAGGFPRNSQEDEFKKLNLGILDTNKSAATDVLIKDWYRDTTQPQPELASRTQNSDAVPAGWAGHDDLYLKVIKPSCRGCHITRDPGKDFGAFADFNGRGSIAHTFVCSTRTMPQAKVTYQKFWLERLGAPYGNQVGVINQSGVTGWNAATPCPQ